MGNFLFFIIGLAVGIGLYWLYSFITDKINLLKLGYNGGSYILRYFYKKLKYGKSSN